MLKKIKAADGSSLLFLVLLFSAFAFLAYLFPYSGDDWGWGSQLGLDRLQNWFADYNGRYAGNLLVLALTRSTVLKMLVMSACIVAVCLLVKMLAGARGITFYAFSVMLLLFIPKEIFTQAVVWTSGFSNYVPPVVLTLVYLVAVKNIFEDEAPMYKPVMCFFAPVISFVGALFIENVTLFNIFLSAFVAVYTYVRFKKAYSVHVLHFIGAVSGAVLMFSNSAYGLVAKGEDFYRTTFVESGFYETLTENLKELVERFFAENVLALAVFSVLLAVLCHSFIKTEEKGIKRQISFIAVNMNLLCFFIFLCKGRLYDWDLFFENSIYSGVTIIIFGIAAMLYFISAVVAVFICVSCTKTKSMVLLMLFGIMGLVAPLMLVRPIGPRCFFPTYAFLMAACVTMLKHITDIYSLNGRSLAKLCKIFFAVSLVMLSFLYGIYGVIHHYDFRRNELVKKQAESGFKTVITYYLPYIGYVWNGDPDIEPWDEEYKLFHGIDDEVKFRFILRENLEDFEKNFEQ